jgi:Protein of unknown function DUF58
VVAISLTSAGWALVIGELMVIGVGVGLLALVAFLAVWLPFGNAVQFTRSFLGRGVHSGDSIRVDLVTQGRWTPALSVQELLPGGRSVTAHLAGKGRTLTFETPILHRGLNLIGPTIVRRADFFSLFARTSVRTNSTPLIVWPERIGIESAAVRKLLIDPSRQPRIGVMKPGRPIAAFEGDLRAYVPGDEPRRIHWPSSARTGNLVVRTDASIVSDNRYVLTIDLDTAHHSADSFELALSVATSLVLALLPVPAASLHREDSFDDDLVVEVLEGEHSPTPGRNRFRYPELLLDRLAAATYTASNQPSVGTALSRVASVSGGLVIGGPSTNFAGASLGIRCSDARTMRQLDRSQAARLERLETGQAQSGANSSRVSHLSTHDRAKSPGPRDAAPILQLSELKDLPELVKESTVSRRSPQPLAQATPASHSSPP